MVRYIRAQLGSAHGPRHSTVDLSRSDHGYFVFSYLDYRSIIASNISNSNCLHIHIIHVNLPDTNHTSMK
jgi:hypothetical protein